MSDIKKKVCDQCGNEWIDVSPPSKESYEHGRISLVEGTILLSEKVAQRVGTHASFIRGDYCSPECLFARLKAMRRGEGLNDRLRTRICRNE